MAEDNNRWEPVFRSSPPGWSTHPRKAMLMTPMLVFFGGIFAFAIPTLVAAFFQMAFFNPPVSDNWAPYTEHAIEGRDIYVRNGCVYCHSGYTRPQDVRKGLYYTYSRISLPGDFATSNEAPNVWGTARIGPDISQEGGLHPDDWQRAHFSDARFTTPNSLMPRWNFFSDEETEALIAFVQQRGGKSALVRYAGQQVMKDAMLTAMNMVAPPSSSEAEAMTLADVAKGIKMGGFMQMGGDGHHETYDGLDPHDALMLSMVDRGYWLAKNPLPVTKDNLVRGRMIFEERCIGCHGEGGSGVSLAARFLRPAPADFTGADDTRTAPDTSPGDWYYRVLRGIRGTAMENFGTRLRVDDIWRVVMFLRTIPNGGLRDGTVPDVDQYIAWEPPDSTLQFVQAHPEEEAFSFLAQETQSDDPFLLEANRILNGMVMGQSFEVSGFGEVSLTAFRDRIEQKYNELLNTGWDDFIARDGHPIPPESQKQVLPDLSRELR